MFDKAETILVSVIVLLCICSKATDANDVQNPASSNITLSILNKNFAILTWIDDNINQQPVENYEVIMSYNSACSLEIKVKNITGKISRNSNIFLYAFEDLCPNKNNRVDLCIRSTSQEVNSIINKSLTWEALPREPTIAPVVDIGSFFVDNNEDVHIYWKQINSNDYYDNVANFTIEITNEHQSTNSTIDVLKSSATIKKDWFNTTSSAEFKLRASNTAGPAINATWMKIPSKDRRCKKPENIQVLKMDDIYYVSWTKPLGNHDITSYTVFWGTSIAGSPTQLDSPLDFKRVNGTFDFNLKSGDNDLQFGVSANTESSSSGIMWEECKAETDPTLIGQVENLKSTTNFTNKIIISWTSKCKDRYIVKNYIIEICAVKDMTSNCIEAVKTYKTNSTSYNVDKLEQNTIYKVTVTMESATTRSKLSTFIHVKTALPVWKDHAVYVLMAVFLFSSSVLSVYWIYYKMQEMKDIKVNIPFGLNLDMEELQKKSKKKRDIITVMTVVKERLRFIFGRMKSNRDSAFNMEVQVEIIPSAPALDTSSTPSSRAESNQDSAVTVQDEIMPYDPALETSSTSSSNVESNQDEIMPYDPALETSSTLSSNVELNRDIAVAVVIHDENIPSTSASSSTRPSMNFMTHPVLETESSPTLVHIVHKVPEQYLANGYVRLPDLALGRIMRN